MSSAVKILGGIAVAVIAVIAIGLYLLSAGVGEADPTTYTAKILSCELGTNKDGDEAAVAEIEFTNDSEELMKFGVSIDVNKDEEEEETRLIVGETIDTFELEAGETTNIKAYKKGSEEPETCTIKEVTSIS